jgi:serine/threonine-protein kinase
MAEGIDRGAAPPELRGVLIDGRYRLIRKCEDRVHPLLERYEAEQLGLTRRVQVEILRLRNGEGAALEERFKREGELLARFDHPSIVAIHDSGAFQGCPYLVRPQIEGRTLESLSALRTTWSIGQVCTILADIADGLEEIHRAGVIARHLTPSDIVISPSGRARISDLRTARDTRELEGEDARGDLASLGAIGRELVPGEGPRMIAPARARLHGLIDRLVAKDPADRPASAALVAAALRAIGRQADESERDTLTEGSKAAVPAATPAEAPKTPETQSSEYLRAALPAWRVGLGDPVRRNMVIAGIAGSVLFLVAISIAASSGDEPATSAAIASVDQSARARTARMSINRGDTAPAIADLERALVEDGHYGNAKLHAALAHAYVRSGRGPESLQHFSIALRADPDALEESDVNELVGLMALPQKDGDRATELVVALGDRARPALSDVAGDESSDKALRARAKEALRTLGAGAKK